MPEDRDYTFTQGCALGLLVGIALWMVVLLAALILIAG